MSTLKSQFIGAWELVDISRYRGSDPDDKIYSMEPNAQGMIVYTSDGYMSAQLRTPGQSHFKADGPYDGTDEEYAQAGRNYLAYAGPYYLDESGKETVLVHHMKVSSFPNWLGNTQRRIFSFWTEGGDLYLTLSPEKPSPVMGELAR